MNATVFLRPAIVVAVSLLAATSSAVEQRKPGTQVLGSCAAFSQQGKTAAVTFDDSSVALEITDSSGKSSHLVLPLWYDTQMFNGPLSPISPTACDAHFDEEGDLVAVAVANRRVVLADVNTMKWVGDWDEGIAGIANPTLVGFLEGTKSLVIAGEPHPEDGNGIHWGLYVSALFNSSGRQLMPSHIQRYAPDGHIFPRFPDAIHNRLWVFRCEPVDAPISRQPPCPIMSTDLTDNRLQPTEFVPPTQGWKREDLWFSTTAFVAPADNLIVLGEGTAIWSIDTNAQMVRRYVLPRQPHFPSFEQIYRPVALSHDGQFMAVAVARSRVAFPFIVDNYVFQGVDIDIIQIDPLRLVEVYHCGRTEFMPGFAIDHRQGKVTILLYRNNRWERKEVNVASLH